MITMERLIMMADFYEKNVFSCSKCGQQIVSGFPINYGQLNPGQDSAEQKITIKNKVGLPTGVTIMIKGGNWISDETEARTTISGPEYTHYENLLWLWL